MLKNAWRTIGSNRGRASWICLCLLLAALYFFSPAWFWGGSVPPVDPASFRPAGL
ncbi:MAG: hypothetical protein WCP58_07490 [bacterium]